MLAICDDYATEYVSISFNASKSKCSVVLPGNRRIFARILGNCPFYDGNNQIYYVNSFAHLGHVITNQLNETADILQRRSDCVRQAILCHMFL